MAIVEAIKEVFSNIGNWVIYHLRGIASFLQLGVTYFVLYLVFTAQSITTEMWWLILGAPIFIALFAAFLRWYANRVGKGNTVPIPTKRFTEVDREDGMVTMEHDRIQELLLYVADLEDWLERMGLL